jgi:hypothetical protein
MVSTLPAMAHIVVVTVVGSSVKELGDWELQDGAARRRRGWGQWLREEQRRSTAARGTAAECRRDINRGGAGISLGEEERRKVGGRKERWRRACTR